MTGTLRNVYIFLLISRAIYEVAATTYSIENTALALGSAGGRRFDEELGNTPMLAVMAGAEDYCLQTFSLGPTRLIDHVTLFIEEFDGVAYATGGNIHLSAGYVEDNNQGNTNALRLEITGVLYHEMTHVVQNSAVGIPGGVIEGIADFIRLRAGYDVWTMQPGGKWDDGYSTTAFFFDWIDRNYTEGGGFVNRLNQKIGQAGWNITFFDDLTGKSVDTLWQEYQMSI